jgi:GTP cyclohydrolase II
MKQSITFLDKYMGTRVLNDLGVFLAGGYKTSYHNNILTHLILYKGLEQPTPVRIQSGCLTADIFGDQRCDCHSQLVESMKYISSQNNGLIIYTVEHDGRGRGTLAKMKVYALKDLDQIDSQTACKKLNLPYELRDYYPLTEVLKDIGLKNIILLSKNLQKKAALENEGLNVVCVKNIFEK